MYTMHTSNLVIRPSLKFSSLFANIHPPVRYVSSAKRKRSLRYTKSPLPSSKQRTFEKSKVGNSISPQQDSMPPYKFGSYSGLNLPEESQRQGIQKLVSKITDFNELKLLPEIRKALIEELKHHTVLRSQNYVSPSKKVKSEEELNGLIIRPTPIQTAAIKIINDKRDPSEFFKVFTLAAETGSGKTWGYLAPLLQQLVEGRKLSEMARKEDDLTTSPVIRHKAGIKSVILVPTHELVDQVFSTLIHTDKSLSLNVLRWDTDSNFKEFIEQFKNGIDVMVTTPGKLLSLSRYDSIQNSRMIFGSVSFCVVDEADTLMDESFVDDTYGVIKNMTNLNTLVFASATIPTKFNKTIGLLFPKSTSISTPSLHKLPKSIEFRVINASVSPYKGSKMKAMAQALYAIHCDGTERGYEKRVIIFVNSKDDCKKVAEKLQKAYNHDAVYISSEDTIEERKAKVEAFIEPPKLLEDTAKPILKVLVCTDLLSRGLNFSGIRNVILLDVPKNSADLVHRAGRTGRMNQSGRVFLIINDQDKSHVKGLPKVIRNNRRLG